jgi:PTS system mannose-specific IIA component
MVGILLVTHLNLGKELIASAEFIMGKLEGCKSLSVDAAKEVAVVRKEIKEAIAQLDLGDGVLILTDMFGGTPANISLSFLKENQVEVLTGANLPMLMKLYNARQGKTLPEISQLIKNTGLRSISLASEILQKQVKPGP